MSATTRPHPVGSEPTDPSPPDRNRPPAGSDGPRRPPGRRASSGRSGVGRHHPARPRPTSFGARRHLLAAVVILLGVGGCAGEHTIPSETRLVVHLEEALEALAPVEGSRVEARLAGNLTAEGEVLLPAGTLLTGRVTRVQEAGDRWPAIVKIAFDSLHVRGVGRAVDARIVDAEVEPVPGEGGSGSPPAGSADGGMAGEILQGRRHAPLVRPETREAEGSGILLGTPAAPARLPAGGRLELELEQSVKVPAAEG